MVFSALKKYNIIATEKIFICRNSRILLQISLEQLIERRELRISIQALIKTAKTNTQVLL